MTQMVVTAAAVMAELLVLFLTGGVMPFAAGDEKKSAAETICAGFVVTHAITEIVSLVALYMHFTLTKYVYVLAGALCFAAALSVVVNFSSVFRGTSVFSGGIGFRFSAFIALLVAAGCAALVIILPGAGDPGHVIARVAKDVYTDTFGVYVPGTGEKAAFTIANMHVRYYGLDELIVRLTGLHPMTEMKIVRSVVTHIVSSLIIYRVFYRLFDSNTIRASFAAILTYAAGLLFRTPYTPQGLLYGAGWTGEAAIACVMIPFVLLLAQALYDRPGNIRLWLLAVLAGIASVSFTESSLLIIPCAMAAVFIPTAVIRKKWMLLLLVPAGAAVPLIVLLIHMNALAVPAL